MIDPAGTGVAGGRESVVRVPPNLMAGMRQSARTRGKSDPIDALAVARAVLREPDLPVAHHDGPSRDMKLLVDHREQLVGCPDPAGRTGCAGSCTNSTPN